MTCIYCNKESESDTWELGECCLFGTLYACSRKCALDWIKQEDIARFDESTDLNEVKEYIDPNDPSVVHIG